MSLPYRLRPPVYGGKLKQQKHREAAAGHGAAGDDSADALVGGGPTQLAIHLDLMELRPRFLERLVPGPYHCPAGSAFASFKEVFSECKVALLHSRTTPPRCDRDSYSQLVYSVCLSMLRESIDEKLEHAAFALFCLYALYETNLLLVGPQDERSELEMVPLGLQSVENPKNLFRRSFKTAIRIDRQHHLVLQRLRDEASAAKADCKIKGFEEREHKISGTQYENATHDDDINSCVCGIATDTIYVLDRLNAYGSFDRVEYTGPCGLEGLAGHEDYPYRCTRPRKSRKEQTHPLAKEQVMTDAQLDVVGLPKVASSSNELSSFGKSYWADLDSIWCPPERRKMPVKHSQIKTALQTLWRNRRSRTSWNEVYGNSTDVVDSEVSMMPAATTSTRGHDDTYLGQQITAENNGDCVVNDVSYRIVFPNDLMEVTKNCVHEALTKLMDRDGAAVLAQAAESHRRVNVTIPPTIIDRSNQDPDIHMDDDRSSLEHQGALSVTSSLVTGKGQVALRQLLLSASAVDLVDANSHSRTSHQVAAVSSESRVTGVDQARRAFLTMEKSSPEAENSDARSVSDVSGLSSDDDVSMAAASAVGETALRQLLATVNRDPTLSSAPKAKTRKRNRTNSAPRKGSVSPRRRKIKRTAAENGSTLRDDDSFASGARGSGKAALDALLSRVESFGAHDSDDDRSSVC